MALTHTRSSRTTARLLIGTPRALYQCGEKRDSVLQVPGVALIAAILLRVFRCRGTHRLERVEQFLIFLFIVERRRRIPDSFVDTEPRLNRSFRDGSGITSVFKSSAISLIEVVGDFFVAGNLRASWNVGSTNWRNWRLCVLLSLPSADQEAEHQHEQQN